jgi:hypothetical protein
VLRGEGAKIDWQQGVILPKNYYVTPQVGFKTKRIIKQQQP